MSRIPLDDIEKHHNEPKMRKLASGFVSLPSVGMRLAPEILILELFREVFLSASPGRSTSRELRPDLRNEETGSLEFNPGERAVITSIRGRRKQTKWSKEDPYYAPAYPTLARASWLSKKRERVIARLLFEGAFAQHFWCRGEHSTSAQGLRLNAVETIVQALAGLPHEGHPDDILGAALGVQRATIEFEAAKSVVANLTGPSSTVFETDRDELADRIVSDFLIICRLEKRIPRLLWIRILMTYLRFALPMWLLAQMQITCLVHRWFVRAFNGDDYPTELEILTTLSKRNRDLIQSTLTPTGEIFDRISEYIRCRVELNIALFCLEKIQPDIKERILTTRKMGSGYLKITEALSLARNTSSILKNDEAYGAAPDVAMFLARASERYRAWRDPRNKGQGKNIDEFLRVLYRAERGDEAGGHLLTREGRGESAGFRIFPGQLLLQTIAFLAAKTKQNGLQVGGGGKLVLRDIEEHFAQYGIDFSLAADARPRLIQELQALGLLTGTPDAGSSVAVSSPF